MQRRAAFMTGLGAGAALMFLIDPERGRRRRAVLRGKIVRGAHVAGDAAGTVSRDLRNRVAGAAAKLARATRQQNVPDTVLVERVRARLGRYSSHPRAIHVTARTGVVTLEGEIVSHERAPVLDAIISVPGVSLVEDRLRAHDTPGHLPGLQGGVPRSGEPFEWWQRRWSPTARLAAGTAAGALMAYGATRRDAAGAGVSVIGLGLLARSVANLEMSRLVGIRAGRRAVDLQKTIDIGAPVERVFALWRNYEEFPKFVSRVIDVRPTRISGQSHWTVRGPAGTTIQFDTVLTDYVPNRLIAWKTTASAAVAHAGLIRFAPNLDDTTRLNIRISYTPPGGAIAHAAASMFRQDLRHVLDDELVRIKTYLETGRPARDAATPPAETVMTPVE